MTKKEEKPQEDEFIELLEQGVTKVLKTKGAEPKDILDAVNAGAKLLLIKHKISGSGDDGSFFK